MTNAYVIIYANTELYYYSYVKNKSWLKMLHLVIVTQFAMGQFDF